MEDKQKKTTSSPQEHRRSLQRNPFTPPQSPGVHMSFKGQSSGVSSCLEMLIWDMISQAWVVEGKMPEEK